jgi:hypothetical protein
MNIMEPKLLTEVESAEYHELPADQLDLVSGGRENGHYLIAGVSLDINWDQGSASWSIWGGAKGEIWGPGM